MKLSSLFLAGLFVLFFWIIFPYILINVNDYLNLPFLKGIFFEVVGILLVIIGGSVALYCFGLFVKSGKGTPVPIDPSKKLVVKGLYKYTRNPMYLAYMMIIFGEFLIFGNIMLLIYFLLAGVCLQILVVFWEEPKLVKRFGKDYLDYKKEVPRWL